jgi:hypothetical protein
MELDDESDLKPDVKHAKYLLEYMDRHSKFLQWDRDVNGKLYYAFWIVFMGGFVLSINSTVKLVSATCFSILLLRVFRILAVIGSALNFLLQNKAIDSASYSHRALVKYEQQIALSTTMQNEAAEALQQAESAHSKSKQIDAWIPPLECALKIIAAVFLLLALFLTWNIIPLIQTK